MTTQTRLGSFVESIINVIIGFIINYSANLLIFPLFGMHISAVNNFYLGCIYTIISVVRSYIIRRYFNSQLTTTANRVTGWFIR